MGGLNEIQDELLDQKSELSKLKRELRNLELLKKVFE